MKMKPLQIVIISFALCYTNMSIGQWTITGSDIYNANTGNVGIGTGGIASPSAKLEIKSTTSGFLMPRLTITQRNAILSPVTGLMIYQTNSTPGFYYYTGSAWKAVIQKPKGWNLTGNSGTDPSLNFIGTTDAKPLVFKINNQLSGTIDYNTLYANTSLGYQTLNGPPNTFYDNVAIGFKALYTNSASFNTAVGAVGLVSNVNGAYNTAIGYAALAANANAFYNTAIGAQSMKLNSSGYDNSVLGKDALYNNTTGNDNTAIGFSALKVNTAGNSNTALGASADVASNNLNNTTALGYATNVSASNSMVFGNSSVTKWGFGTNAGATNIFEFANTTAKLTTGGVWTNASDKKLKNNFQKLNKQDMLDKILKLDIERWHYIKDNENITHIGPVAQDFYEVFKVGDDTTISTIDPAGIALIGLQQLKKENDDLKSQVISQQQQINELKSMMISLQQNLNGNNLSVSNTSLQQSAQFISNSSVLLEQNIPNPLNHTTTINYTLPKQYTSAKIIITDKSGKTLKEVNLSGGGKGSLRIDASAFANGVYNYSLYVNGNLIESKQMILSK